MATCWEIFTFSWPLRGRGGGVNPSGQPDRFFPVVFLNPSLIQNEKYDIYPFCKITFFSLSRAGVCSRPVALLASPIDIILIIWYLMFQEQKRKQALSLSPQCLPRQPAHHRWNYPLHPWPLTSEPKHSHLRDRSRCFWDPVCLPEVQVCWLRGAMVQCWHHGTPCVQERLDAVQSSSPREYNVVPWLHGCRVLHSRSQVEQEIGAVLAWMLLDIFFDIEFPFSLSSILHIYIFWW